MTSIIALFRLICQYRHPAARQTKRSRLSTAPCKSEEYLFINAADYRRLGSGDAGAVDIKGILGDDGVPVEYHITFWKSEVIDYVILQQDAFDSIDALCPLERQKFMLELVLGICDHEFKFENFDKCREKYKELINLLRQMNYSEFKSEKFNQYLEQLNKVSNND